MFSITSDNRAKKLSIVSVHLVGVPVTARPPLSRITRRGLG